KVVGRSIGETEDEHPTGVLPRLVDVPLERVLVGAGVVPAPAGALRVGRFGGVGGRRAATGIRRRRRVAVLEDVEALVPVQAEPHELRPEVDVVDVRESGDAREALEVEAMGSGGYVDRRLVRGRQTRRSRDLDSD